MVASLEPAPLGNAAGGGVAVVFPLHRRLYTSPSAVL